MNFNIKQHFEGYTFFHSYLGNRINIALGLSLFVGVLDGFGLSMFLPLLQIVSGATSVNGKELGGLEFLMSLMEFMNFAPSLFSVLVIMVAFFLLKGALVFVQFYYRVYLQERLILKIRTSLIHGLNSIHYKEFIRMDAGKVQNTLSGEVERVSRSYQSYFQIVQCAIMVLVYMGFAFFVDAAFAFLVTAGGLITNLLYRKIYLNTKGASRKLTTNTHNFHGLILQYVSNFKYLKATGTLKKYGEKLENSARNIETNNKHIGTLMAILNATREPLIIIVVAIIIYMQIEVLGSSFGPILISLLFFYRALSNLMQLQTHLNFYLSVSGSLIHLKEFEKELTNHQESNGILLIDKFESKLEVEKGCFSYPNRIVLEEISLTICKYETIAFVGESGSGKTTLVNVLAGLLSIDNGMYTIDGKNRVDINIHSFQNRIGYITQDPVIFNDTVFNNVTFWDEKSDSNIAKFWRAVEKAAAIDFVQRLTDKEETILGNSGVNLSGGQKQRISIARELYKEIDILILDEATSALDSQTEQEIKENIEQLKGAYTLLIVAHRLSTIRYADRIVLLKNGKIETIDSFKGLMDRSEIFNRMVKLQELT